MIENLESNTLHSVLDFLSQQELIDLPSLAPNKRLAAFSRAILLERKSNGTEEKQKVSHWISQFIPRILNDKIPYAHDLSMNLKIQNHSYNFV